MQTHIQLSSNVCFKFISSTSSGTNCRDGFRHPLLLGKVQEGSHDTGGEPDEVQPTLPIPYNKILHLLLLVSVATVPVGEVVGQILPNIADPRLLLLHPGLHP